MGNKSRYRSWLLWLAPIPAVVLAVLSEFSIEWGTPGQAFARYMLNPRGLEDFSSVSLTALGIDSVLYWLALWGIIILENLWNGVRNQVAEHTASGLSTAVRASTICGAMLCALPLAYHAMLTTSTLLYGGHLPKGKLPLAGSMVASFIACFLVIYGLYELAIRFVLRGAAAK